MKSLLPVGLLTLVSLVFAQDNRSPDPNQQFIYPPLPGPQWSNDPTVFEKNENITYGVPMSQPFKWKTNTTMIIIMYQEGNPGSVKSRALTGCTSNDFVYWDGQLGNIDIKNGSVMFLGASNCTSSGSSYTITSVTPAFFSHYFNLTEAPNAVTSSTTSSTTSTGTNIATAPTATSTGTGTPAPSQSTISQSSGVVSEGGPSNAATIGAGVGGGLGGALILVGAAFLYLRHRNKQKKQEQMQGQQRQQYNGIPAPYAGQDYYSDDKKYVVQMEPQELQAKSIGSMPPPRFEAP